MPSQPQAMIGGPLDGSWSPSGAPIVRAPPHQENTDDHPSFVHPSGALGAARPGAGGRYPACLAIARHAVEEAFDRYEVDPDDFPTVQVHIWPGARVSARLATPPAPRWMARTPPPLAELERRLQEGLP